MIHHISLRSKTEQLSVSVNVFLSARSGDVESRAMLDGTDGDANKKQRGGWKGGMMLPIGSMGNQRLISP